MRRAPGDAVAVAGARPRGIDNVLQCRGQRSRAGWTRDGPRMQAPRQHLTALPFQPWAGPLLQCSGNELARGRMSQSCFDIATVARHRHTERRAAAGEQQGSSYGLLLLDSSYGPLRRANVLGSAHCGAAPAPPSPPAP